MNTSESATTSRNTSPMHNNNIPTTRDHSPTSPITMTSTTTATATNPARIGAKTPRSQKSKHRKINKAHPEFELTYDMMLGIRTVVGKTEAQIHSQLIPADFEATIKLKFPGRGSAITPAHYMRDFKFKDYSSEVFRLIREKFQINPADYLMCVCGNFQYLEFVSNSKSGQFFFYTHDRKYMIKTVSQAECKFLRKILPSYYEHIANNPQTLLTRFYGMHRVKPHKKKEVHFLIMGSVFYTNKYIHTVYDLKGSKQGRSATETERKSTACVYKDNDFTDKHCILQIGTDRASILNKQIAADVEFLRKLDIMDYSLLLGIHYRDREKSNNPNNLFNQPNTNIGSGPQSPVTVQQQQQQQQQQQHNNNELKDDSTLRYLAQTPTQISRQGVSLIIDTPATAAAPIGNLGLDRRASLSTNNIDQHQSPTATAAATVSDLTATGGVIITNSNQLSPSSVHFHTDASSSGSSPADSGKATPNNNNPSASAGNSPIMNGGRISPTTADKPVNIRLDPNNPTETITGTDPHQQAQTQWDSYRLTRSMTAGDMEHSIKPPLNSILSMQQQQQQQQQQSPGPASSGPGLLNIELVGSTTGPQLRSMSNRRQSQYGLPKRWNLTSKPSDIHFNAPEFEPIPVIDSPKKNTITSNNIITVPSTATTMIANSASSNNSNNNNNNNNNIQSIDSSNDSKDPVTITLKSTNNNNNGESTTTILTTNPTVLAPLPAVLAANNSIDSDQPIPVTIDQLLYNGQLIYDNGGIPGLTPDSNYLSNEVYFMGIIDILTIYSVKKRLETVAKGFKYDRSDISAIDPKRYAERFRKFLAMHIQ